MIQIFTTNSIEFLLDLAAWLLTPVPFAFTVLFLMVFIFQIVRGFIRE